MNQHYPIYAPGIIRDICLIFTQLQYKSLYHKYLWENKTNLSERISSHGSGIDITKKNAHFLYIFVSICIHTSQEHIFYFAKTHFSYIHSKMLLIPNAKMQFSVQTRKTCQKKVDVQPVPLDQMTTPSGWQDFYFCASLLERYFQCF